MTVEIILMWLALLVLVGAVLWLVVLVLHEQGALLRALLIQTEALRMHTDTLRQMQTVHEDIHEQRREGNEGVAVAQQLVREAQEMMRAMSAGHHVEMDDLISSVTVAVALKLDEVLERVDSQITLQLIPINHTLAGLRSEVGALGERQEPAALPTPATPELTPQ